MSNAGAKLRAAAAETVDAVVSGGRSLDHALARTEQGLRPDDRALLRMLCYGTLRHHWRLNEWISRLLSRPFRRRDAVVNALLAMGLYQLTDTRIPEHAVVSQTVEATRQLRRPKLAGVVNACLRRFMREGLAEAVAGSEESRWNHPQWLLERIAADWPDDCESVLAANNERAPMWLRVNRSRQTVQHYIDSLRSQGIEAEPQPGIDDAVRLASPRPVDSLPGFHDGDVSVQDGAAQIAGLWFDNTPGRVLDACAAPGGKTAHLLEIAAADSVTAVDIDAARAAAIEQNLDRIGRIATIHAADASNPKGWWDGEPFDGVLLDVPCSATGVIRRHPDIRLLRRESDIDAFAQRQSALLTALWPLLRPGGRLLYVTCSVLAAENDRVTGQFLQNQADAFENDVLPNNNIRDLMRRKACGYQILPGTADLDGFYYACLEKTKVP